MSKAKVIFGMIGAGFLSIGADAAELPAGPNKDVVARTCGSCHDLDMVFDAAGQTREGWNGTNRRNGRIWLEAVARRTSANSRIPRELSRTAGQEAAIDC